jgi:hypothetical protein
MSLQAASAFASRARVLVLGNADPLGIATHGSFFYDDTNNIFYNPSYLSDHSNWITIEQSNGGNSRTAEGGLAASIGTLSLGAYFNRGDAIYTNLNSNPAVRVLENNYNGGSDFRPVDLMASMDLGFKLGLGATIGSFSTPAKNSSDITLRAGAQVADLEPFVNYKIKGNGTIGGVDTTSKNFSAGTKYRFGEWTPFVAYRYIKLTTTAEAKTDSLGGGIARNTKITEGANLRYSLSFWRDSGLNWNIIPFNIGIENAFTSWLVGRAGLTFNLMDTVNGTSRNDTTSARIGATLTYSKVDFDFAIGHTAGTETVQGPTFDIANGFFSAASLTYRI